jgi:hypothetical protein
VQRQNVAAWYVCENQNLYINLGAYLYGTPAGCADQTVSFPFFSLLECWICIFSVEGGCIWRARLLTVEPDPLVREFEG